MSNIDLNQFLITSIRSNKLSGWHRMHKNYSQSLRKNMYFIHNHCHHQNLHKIIGRECNRYGIVTFDELY